MLIIIIKLVGISNIAAEAIDWLVYYKLGKGTN